MPRIFLLKVIPASTRDQIVSFGERMSSLIVAAAMDRAEQYNALDFIRTRAGQVDFKETNRLIAERFRDYGPSSPAVSLGVGFSLSR